MLCKLDTDCPGGFCQEGVCVECRSDADCPSGTECVAGACESLQLRLDAPGQVQLNSQFPVKVLDQAGKPVGGAQVIITFPSGAVVLANTDADGRVVYTAAEIGTAKLFASKRGSSAVGSVAVILFAPIAAGMLGFTILCADAPAWLALLAGGSAVLMWLMLRRRLLLSALPGRAAEARALLPPLIQSLIVVGLAAAFGACVIMPFAPLLAIPVLVSAGWAFSMPKPKPKKKG